MLDDVNKRIEELGKELSVKKKKKKDKHSRKHKKEKKKSKKYDLGKNDDSADSSSDSSVEWIESSSSSSHSANTEKAWKVKKNPIDPCENPAVAQRDEWMTLDFMSIKTVSAASLKAEKEADKVLEQQKTQAAEQSILSEKELNPYWKDGGTCLPPEEGEATSSKVTVVEDAGLSWLQKSYQRMKEQSEREKRSFEEIVAERYGSVEIFQSRLEEAKKAAPKKEKDYSRGRWKKINYFENEHSERQKREIQMEKETQDEGDGSKGSYKEHSMDRYNKVYPQEDRWCRRDRSREPRESRLGNREPELRETHSKTVKSFDQKGNEKASSQSTLKYRFLKPDEDSSSRRRNKDYKVQNFPGHGSLSSSFQKPMEDSEEAPVRSRTQVKEGNGKPASDKIPFKTEKTGTSGEEEPEDKRKKQQERLPGNITEKRELLLDRRASPLGLNTAGISSSHILKDEPPQALSDEEMNKLAAKVIQAELMGNTELASKLQGQLDNARKLKESGTQIPARKQEGEAPSLQEDHEVILVRTDQSGRAWPVNASAEPLEPKGGRRKRQMVATHVDKERVRYFQDDDNLSLKDLVRNEKMRTAEDKNRLFMRIASKVRHNVCELYI
uniref:CWF19-like protein 2 n=1 Tax=Sphenodon punctatus TaxID=8508 RepID=A0A8D0LAJ1_SPHPU